MTGNIVTLSCAYACHLNNKSHMRILGRTLKCDQMLISAGLRACCVVVISAAGEKVSAKGWGA